MKYCKNCGKELTEEQKVCTKCGMPVNQQNKTEQPKEQKKMSKKTIIIIAIIALLLLLIFAVYKVFDSKLSPVNEAKEISTVIKKGNTKNLKDHLKFNNRNLNQTESRAFYDYIVEADSSDRFADEVESKVKEMQENDEQSTSINADDEAVIQVKKKGKKYGIFDNYDFEVVKESVSINPDTDSTITYEYDGKKQKIKLVEDNEKMFATLPIGNYNLKATKEQGNKKFEGEVIVNMASSYEAIENFKQKNIAVNIDSEYSYGDEDVNIYINGTDRGTYDSYNETVYGPFLPDEKVEVYAEITVNDKTFKTDTVNVDKAEDGEDEITVDLSFDDEAIKDYEENEDLKEDVQTFMEDYIDALNEAYEEEDYMYVSSYIKSSSDTADHIENVVEDGGGTEFSSLEVTKYDKKGKTITIETTKEDQDGNSIKSKYVLDYDSTFSEFKIKDYTDI